MEANNRIERNTLIDLILKYYSWEQIEDIELFSIGYISFTVVQDKVQMSMIISDTDVQVNDSNLHPKLVTDILLNLDTIRSEMKYLEYSDTLEANYKRQQASALKYMNTANKYRRNK